MESRVIKPATGLIVLAFVLTGTFLMSAGAWDPGERDYYQMKIYSIENETQEARMDAYLENAFIPACHRAGIPAVGVFKPIRGNDNQDRMIVVWIPFKSAGAFAELPGKLDRDKKYLEEGRDYIEAPHDNPPYARIESILMRSFKGMPEFSLPDHSVPPAERIYELRSYQGATERIYERKVEMFNDAGEIDLFVKLGFQPVFFGEVISGPDMPNLMYMTTFAGEEAQDELWNSFRVSDEWQVMKTLERYRNTVSHIDKFLLHPTAYSDF